MDYNNVLTSSILFENIINVISKTAITINDLEESFLAEAFNWNGYTFKLFVGQGSYWTVEKNNELIFCSV